MLARARGAMLQRLGFISSGARIDQETAKALVEAPKLRTSREIGHAVYLKLFTEFANALELERTPLTYNRARHGATMRHDKSLNAASSE